MDRRKFISRSSLALIAAAGLPKGILNKPYSSITYKTKLEPSVEKQTYYELIMDNNALVNFKTATDDEKKIYLKVAYFENTDITNPTIGGEFIYKIKDVINTDSVNNIWKIKTKFDKRVSGDYKFSKEFPKNMTLVGKSYLYFNIIDKNDQSLINIPYPTTASTGSGSSCFLTTACVVHKQLNDDCNELTTLRFLRDAYMINDENNISLINDYQIYGPAIVEAINNCTNKQDIYNYMYDNMIMPSVELVKEKRFAEAVDHYKIFVKALAEKYL